MFALDKNYGDEYIWASTCRFIDFTTVELLGVTKPIKLTEWKAILKTMHSIGVEKVIYKRYKNDELIIKQTKTNR